MSERVSNLQTAAESYFVKCFATEPRWVSLAPGRVNLIGDHTDYTGGFAMPMAIDRHTLMCANLSDDQPAQMRLYSSAVDSPAIIDLSKDMQRVGNWSDYARGIIDGFQKLGHVIPSLDIACHNDLPQGAGLSSSASFELALTCLLAQIVGVELSHQQKIALSQAAEHNFAQVPCGILDQYSVSCGQEDHLMLLDCESEQAEQIAFIQNEEGQPQYGWLIVHSGVNHALGDGEYAQRHAECRRAELELGSSLRRTKLKQLDALSTPTLKKRAHHVLSENQRVIDAAQAVRSQQWQRVGSLMQQSHESLRDDFEVSCTEVDQLVDILIAQPGVYGARMTGGGFGGAVVALVDLADQQEIQNQVTDMYQKACRINANSFLVKASQGARVL